MSKWLTGLNAEQAEAVNHNHGPLLILAGAGSGKTTVLVSRTGRLIEEKVASASQIAVLTFTNKAARELKHRVQDKVGPLAKGLWAGTFHSFGLQLLRKNYQYLGLTPNFGVLDQSDSQAVIKDLCKTIKTSKDKFDADKLLSLVNILRSGKKIPPGHLDEYHELAEVIAPKYERKLVLLGVTDFEGLLLEPIKLFKKYPEVLEKTQKQFSQIMVDEFQDTNAEQMLLIDYLSREHKNLTVVGDDDQSIYGWRGAEIANILNFPSNNENCKVVKLEKNYRSVTSILDLGNEVIAKNKKRHGKILRSTKTRHDEEKPEVFILENEDEEADFVLREIQNFHRGQGYKYADIAILYRSNTQGAFIESSLRRNHIPYEISGGTSIFERKEAKDVLAYLKQSILPDEVSLRRILNTPPRGIGETTLEKLSDFALEQKIDLQSACIRWREALVAEKQGESMDQFFKWLWVFPQRVLDDVTMGAGVSERFQNLMRDCGYRDYLAQQANDGLIFDKKWQVVEIVGRILESFLMKREFTIQAMKDFIDAMLLRDDGSDDERKDQVQLMTFHASKGLEFPVVILVGVEEDLIPHKRLGSDIDEERRLFYVGITRAQKKLILTYCRQRKKMGQIKPVFASRFLTEASQSLYSFYQLGARPVSGVERENLVSDFLNKLKK